MFDQIKAWWAGEEKRIIAMEQAIEGNKAKILEQEQRLLALEQWAAPYLTPVATEVAVVENVTQEAITITNEIPNPPPT